MTTMEERLQLATEARNGEPDDAALYWNGGPVEVADRTWFTCEFSAVTAFDTDDGIVLIDSGAAPAAPKLARQIRQRTEAPVHTAIYTHGHVDHAYGLDRFVLPDQAAPRVIGHAAMAERFERYERTTSHNNAINARQFGATVPRGQFDHFHRPPILPTEYYETDQHTIEVGGLTFELHHARGETDDHTWVWCPERSVLCTGDLFIWAVPNGGNPQKVQRYPWDWAAALRRMAELGARSLCPGHGGPVVDDPDKVRHMLTSTADYLESIVAQALSALEDGSPPHVDIVHAVVAPESPLPWLQPLYDDPEFLVRNVIRHYGGWWTGRPSELKPASRHAVAVEIADLAGGVAVLAARAVQLAEAGDLRLAAHLADYALEADPGDPVAQQVVADVYRRRSQDEPSLMASNIFASAVAYAEEARPFA
jgi:glyoxylase-like metal-dependent hydrolase (beta-lactamase superfamily II)